MTEYVKHGSLQVSKKLDDLINEKVCNGINIEPNSFWNDLEKIINDFTPKNNELLQKREDLQSKIDQWHIDNKNSDFDKAAYKSFLEEIGYLVKESGNFSIETENVDPEIASIAGPMIIRIKITNKMIVIPIKIFRFFD